jgi:hypothetical protein
VTQRALAGVLFGVVLLVGCASAPDTRPPALVGSIEVTVDEENLGAHRTKAFRELDGLARVGGGMGMSLRRLNLYSPDGSLTIRAKIVNFRLRNRHSAFWAGLMAGADRLAVRVDVERSGLTIERFTVKQNSIESNDPSRGVGYRLGRMVLKFSRKFGEKFAELDIRDPSLPAASVVSETPTNSGE